MTHEEMLQLKVGDVICDCRFKHLRVTEIEEDRVPTRSFFWFLGWWLPMKLHDFVSDRWPTYVVDKSLTLEDGAKCSAIHCASIFDHEWEHPSE